jgi:hypothetical protein
VTCVETSAGTGMGFGGSRPLTSTSPSAPARAACLLVPDVNDQYNMQDHNHWYALQRSNADQHAHPTQDPTSTASTVTPAVAHATQALPGGYSFASTARPPHGEGFSPSLCNGRSLSVLQWPVTFIYPWMHTYLLTHSPNISIQMVITALRPTLPHTQSMQLG